MKACHQGWFKFTSKYPEINKSHQDNDIVDSNETTIQSSEKDVWETEGRFYHDTKRKNHHAAIKDLKDKCKLNRRSNSTDRKDEKPEPGKKCSTSIIIISSSSSIIKMNWIMRDLRDLFPMYFKSLPKEN